MTAESFSLVIICRMSLVHTEATAKVMQDGSAVKLRRLNDSAANNIWLLLTAESFSLVIIQYCHWGNLLITV
jgi:hypothetical protein